MSEVQPGRGTSRDGDLDDTRPVDPGTAYVRRPPEGWVDLRLAEPAIQFQIGYASDANFVGERLVGYGAAGAWLRRDAAESVVAVQHELAQQGLGLKIFDAYRPRRATLAMVAWAERRGRSSLLEAGYIARRSGHNHGHTVDLTIVRLDTGAELDMGTPWDEFSSASHTGNAQGRVRENRRLLSDAMARHGWVNYEREWWHFSHSGSRSPQPRDIPYGCHEPEEGDWSPPPGWGDHRSKHSLGPSAHLDARSESCVEIVASPNGPVLKSQTGDADGIAGHR
jgi:D-alanyl-D-alanine dipeptidase